MQVDLYADVVCPWCFIGLRRFQAAQLQRPHVVAAVRWRPFQLQPGMPATGIAWDHFVQTKFGGMERAKAMFAHVTNTGKADGIDFRFDLVANSPNTRDAHRLILWAESHGKTFEMAEALFAGHFTRGFSLNNREDLLTLVEEAGLDPEAANAVLSSHDFDTAVTQSQELAGQLGISGVPFYVFNGTHGLSGAQPIELIVRVLDELNSAPASGATAE